MKWWGYLHANGSIQTKRWLGDHKDYTDDCIGNPNVVRVITPFDAHSRAEAEEILVARLKGERD
jgi:hypothetical protein